MSNPATLHGRPDRGTDVLLAYKLGELARSVLSGECGVVHRPQGTIAGNGSKDGASPCDQSKTPQAVRGDAPALTAAAFAALTGFTRSRPTGLGRKEARAGEKPNQLRVSGSSNRAWSGVLAEERVSDVIDGGLASLFEPYRHRVEAKLNAQSGM